MAVKVLIEYKAKARRATELADLLRELRAHAVRQPGYISGETLTAPDDPSHRMVISTWRSVDYWNTWQGNPERVEIAEKLSELLERPAVTSVFAEAYF